MDGLGVIEERLRALDARTLGNHDSISLLRERQGSESERLIRIESKQDEQAKDIAEMRQDLSDVRKEQKAEMAWVRRGLWAAAGTFMLFFVAAASLFIQASGTG